MVRAILYYVAQNNWPIAWWKKFLPKLVEICVDRLGHIWSINITPTSHPHILTPSQRFQEAEKTLQYVMAGFAMPEPFFSVSLEQSLSLFLSALSDPALPLMEMQVGTI